MQVSWEWKAVSQTISKVIKSPQSSVQKPELYAIPLLINFFYDLATSQEDKKMPYLFSKLHYLLSSPRSAKRNEIWQTNDVFHFAEFLKLQFAHHTTDSYSVPMRNCSEFWKAGSVIAYLLEIMAVWRTPAQINTDNALSHVFSEMKQFFAYYNIKHITDISHNSTRQAVAERSSCILKEMLIKQKGRVKNL